MPRPFDEYRHRVGRLIVGSILWALLPALPAAAIGAAVGGSAGLCLGAVAGFIYGSLEFGVLAGNTGLRRAVAAKLRGFGRAVDTGEDRFVGLAYPAYYGTAQRQLETDDDVGFLTVDARGLTFVGDGIEFQIPAAQIAAVRMLRDANSYHLCNRVEVTVRDGEPQEVVVFSSRQGWPHSACNRDNRRLCDEIRALLQPDPDLAQRLAGDDLERPVAERSDA